ncbi:MAG: phage tail assembly protein [Xanthomonadaceae bacterium]|nr:phage tail assembly protein [Xanthomonadaceae bacterium]
MKPKQDPAAADPAEQTAVAEHAALAEPVPHETIALDHPFTTAGGRAIASLSMRRWTLRDYVAMGLAGNTAEEQELALFALLVGLAPGDLDELDGADYAKLQARYQDREPSAEVLAAAATADALTLKYPITTPGGQHITQITLRRPKVRDLRQSGRHGTTAQARETALLALLAGFVPDDLDALDGYDYRCMEARFRGFYRAVG